MESVWKEEWAKKILISSHTQHLEYMKYEMNRNKEAGMKFHQNPIYINEYIFIRISFPHGFFKIILMY